MAQEGRGFTDLVTANRIRWPRIAFPQFAIEAISFPMLEVFQDEAGSDDGADAEKDEGRRHGYVV